MSEKTRFNRRRFLTAILGLGFLTQIRPRQTWISLAGQPGQDTVAAQLASLFRHKSSARIIGLEYLQGVPAEAEVQTLVELVSAGLITGSGSLSIMDPRQLRERLRTQIRQDFEEGRMVKLQGWLISATEARLCALVALTA